MSYLRRDATKPVMNVHLRPAQMPKPSTLHRNSRYTGIGLRSARARPGGGGGAPEAEALPVIVEITDSTIAVTDLLTFSSFVAVESYGFAWECAPQSAGCSCGFGYALTGSALTLPHPPRNALSVWSCDRAFDLRGVWRLQRG